MTQEQLEYIAMQISDAGRISSDEVVEELKAVKKVLQEILRELKK